MGIINKLFYLIVVPSVFVYVGYQVHLLVQPLKAPKLEDTWWGPGKPGKDDTKIKSFKIDIPDSVILDLNNRLKSARPFQPALENANHHYGLNTDLLKKIVDFWKTKYDWRQREEFLNKYPQYTTQIQGLNIHYIHVKPTKTNLKVLPLLLLHGWPGSIREFYEIIPKLTTPQKGQNFVFEVIVPSLPGYGFSQGASKQGLGAAQVAVVFKNLMERLGLKKYYVQGGDWGALIASYMGALYPDRVLGVHSNMCTTNTPLSTMKTLVGSIYPPLVVDKKHEVKMYPLSNVFYNGLLEFGYLHLQATKPDTVGVGLNDSPVGLAAYILEKFVTWTNPGFKDIMDGGLEEKYKYEDLLDNVMIYWITGSITTSVRLYSETLNVQQLQMKLDRVPITVPSACIRFAHEIFYQSDSILKTRFWNMVQSTDVDDGGHFAAFEVPDVLAEDIWTAVGKMEKLH